METTFGYFAVFWVSVVEQIWLRSSGGAWEQSVAVFAAQWLGVLFASL